MSSVEFQSTHYIRDGFCQIFISCKCAITSCSFVCFFFNGELNIVLCYGNNGNLIFLFLRNDFFLLRTGAILL